LGNKFSRKSKTRLGFFIYFVVVIIPMVFPPILNRLNTAEPFVGPFPFIIFCMLLFVLLICAGLFAMFEIEDKRGDLL